MNKLTGKKLNYMRGGTFEKITHSLRSIDRSINQILTNSGPKLTAFQTQNRS